ncbi:MAG: hypothetical protein ABSA02_36920 [Trebonia sp.]|jgi:hypothetical protein
MPSETVVDHCPRWCARAHPTDAYGAALHHASEITSVVISRPGGLTVPDRLDVQAAQYLPDDPRERAWAPAVEIAVYAGDRYRLIGLTPEEARELAGMLAKAADMLSAD